MILYIRWFLIILIAGCGAGFAQECSFDFHVDMSHGDSIIGVNDFGKQTSFKYTASDSIDIYLHVKQSRNGKLKVDFIEAVIEYCNDDIHEWNNSKVDSLNGLFENNWLDNSRLKTALTEWTFGSDLSNRNYPQLLIYKMPSLYSDKTRIDGTKLWEVDDEKIHYNYSIQVLECSGRWAKLKLITPYDELEGWMPWYNLCHRTLALCHHIPEDGVN